MTATAQANAAWKPIGTESSLQTGMQMPQPANSQIGRGQFVTASPSTGYASLNDGATPGQIGVGIGYPAYKTHSDATAGNSAVLLWQGESRGIPSSTADNDSFGATDVGVTYYVADENTPGRLSNRAGNNRSMHGLVLGLFNGLPVLWSGVVAWCVARAVHVVDAFPDARYAKAIDAGAATDLAEANVPRARVHGKVTRVDFVVEGTTLAASGATDYKTMTLSKRDGAGGSPVVVATVDTQTTAFTQWTAVSFTLSAVAGALDLLETDLLTIQESHASSGAIIPAGTLRVFTKVG